MPYRTPLLSRTSWRPWPGAGGLVPVHPPRLAAPDVRARVARQAAEPARRGPARRRPQPIHRARVQRALRLDSETWILPNLRTSGARERQHSRAYALTKPAQAEDQIRSGTREAGGSGGNFAARVPKGTTAALGIGSATRKPMSEWGAERSTVAPNETGRSSS